MSLGIEAQNKTSDESPRGPSSREAEPSSISHATTPASSLTAWERISFALAHGAAAAFLKLFGLKGLYRLGRMLGTVEWALNFRRRRRFGLALHEVFESLSASERRKHTRDHFLHTRCDKLFYLVFDCIPREDALASLTTQNQHLLDEAVGQNKGVYVALCHHGPLHVAGMLMALRGYKIAGVRDRKEGAMRRYVQGLYDQRYPEFRRTRVLYADSFPREIYRCLEEGFVLASAMDVSRVRNTQQKSHEMEVFGRPQLFLTGPLRIAYRSGVTALQAFIVPGPDFQYRLDFVCTLFPDPRPSEEEAVEHAIKKYAENLQEYMRRWPSLLTRT